MRYIKNTTKLEWFIVIIIDSVQQKIVQLLRDSDKEMADEIKGDGKYKLN